MREIKFRGFELDLKQWVYGGYHKHIKRQICPIGDSLKEEDIQHLIIVDGFADWNMPRGIQVATNVDKNSIGQFTGLKDKNGKEIYEGDIVEEIITLKYAPHIITNIKSKTIVKYNPGGFNITPHECRTFEVIGNIYENPELLEVEQ